MATLSRKTKKRKKKKEGEKQSQTVVVMSWSVLAKRNLGVQSKAIDGANVNQSGVVEEFDEGLDAVEVVGGVLIGAPGQRHVENTHPLRLQRAFDLRHEPLRVQRVVEDVGEFEIKRVVAERLVVKVTLDNERWIRNQIHSDGVSHSDSPQRLHLLAHPRTDAERLGGVPEKVFVPKVVEEARKDGNLAVPVSGCPYFAEPGIEGLVKLALYVGLVGGVAGSDCEVFGCYRMMEGLLLLWE